MGNHVAQTVSDASIRALRTLWASIGIDIMAAIGVGLTILLSTGDPLTPAFWLAFAALVVRSALTAMATYFARLKFPPKAV